MRKFLFFVFFSLIFLFCLVKFATAADINWAADAGSTKTAGGCSWCYLRSGPASNAFDENENTFYGRESFGFWGNSADAWVMSEFATAHTITHIKAVFYIGEPGWYGDTYTIEYYDGSWHTANSGTPSNSKQTIDLTGLNYTNVTKVRLSGEAFAGDDYTPGSADVYLYELYAWGPPPYSDCGVRIYDGTSNIAIACEPADALTSPLRIYKGSSIYGIVLVNVADPNASKIRIQTSSGIKALRKL